MQDSLEEHSGATLLRAQSPPNTGSTISIVLPHRSGCGDICDGYLSLWVYND